MQSDKGRKTGGSEMGIDLDAFTGQLDDEIDKLFVPVGDASGLDDGAIGTALQGEGTQDVSHDLKPTKGASFNASLDEELQLPGLPATQENDASNSTAGEGLSDFQEMLDSEVDRLFVPTAEAPLEVEGVPGAKTDETRPSNVSNETVFMRSPADDSLAPKDMPSLAAKSPMSDAQVNDYGNDLSSFEAMLDNEVDRLFVPAGDVPSPEETAEAGAMGRDDQMDLFDDAPTKAISPDGLLDGLDLPGIQDKAAPVPDGRPEMKIEEPSQFELKLDSEIDKLFVPLGDSTPAPASTPASRAEDRPQAKEKIDFNIPKSAAPAGALESLSSLPLSMAKDAVEAPRESDAPPISSTPATGARFATDRELTNMVESLSVAYLSLDWEFSVENLSRMNDALKRLDPYSVQSPETKSLAKMLKAVIHVMKRKPDSVSSQMYEFLRESQELLKTLLLSGGVADVREKKQVKGLVARFKAMGGKTEPERKDQREEVGTAVAAGLDTIDKAVGAERTDPVQAVDIALAQEIDDGERTVEGLKKWMEAFTAEFREAINVIEGENKRLLQVEKIFRKTRALAPFASRLGDIRSVLEKHIALFRKRETGLIGQLGFIQDLDSMVKVGVGDAPAVIAVPPPGQEPAVSEPESPEPETLLAAVPEPEAEEPEVHAQSEVDEPVEEGGAPSALEKELEEVYAFTLEGERYAIPASNIIKISGISVRKARRISERGYATLKDLKPFLGRLKAGVLGKWKEASKEELRSYQFMHLFGSVSYDSKVQSQEHNGIILLSDGTQYGCIFTGLSGISLLSGDIIADPRRGDLIGLIEPESDNPIQVVDVHQLFMEEEDSQSSKEGR